MIRIGNANICNYEKPYIIAELASNHNGDMGLARRLIKEAKDAGCDCVKFQSWTADTIFSAKPYRDNCFLNDDYRDRKDFTLRKIVEAFSISEKDLLEMRDYCDTIGIDFASTPFSEREVDFLAGKLRVNFIKVASMDCNNYPFLKYIGAKGLPVMLSTGLASLAEIATAVDTIVSTGNRQIILLHCVSHYPPDDNDVNLNNMDLFRFMFPSFPVGFSDHTIGIEIPLAAVALGASVLEKHFTLDKNMFGWDHKVSATKDEMKLIVEGALRINTALGDRMRCITEKDIEKRRAFRRSIVAAKDIEEGELLTRENLITKRPGTGMPPEQLNRLFGKRVRRSIKCDEMICEEDL